MKTSYLIAAAAGFAVWYLFLRNKNSSGASGGVGAGVSAGASAGGVSSVLGNPGSYNDPNFDGIS